jgi:hypothetical protein
MMMTMTMKNGACCVGRNTDEWADKQACRCETKIGRRLRFRVQLAIRRSVQPQTKKKKKKKKKEEEERREAEAEKA